MKKIIAIIMLLLILCIPFSTLADSLSEQLANLNTEDLNKLYSAIENELIRRGGSDNLKKIVTGYYVVGKHLPAGTYELTATKGVLSFSVFYVYASMDYYRESKSLFYKEVIKGTKIRIDLEENNVLEILGSSEFYIKKVDPIIFDL